MEARLGLLNEGFYWGTTLQFYELLNQEHVVTENSIKETDEFSEVESAIIELLSDGKKRTISEMIADSNKLANVSNMKLAARSRELMEKGVLEKSISDGKAYFSVVGKYKTLL